MSKYLGREAILAAQDIAIEEVHVPEWGGTVLVRGMTGTQRSAFEKSITREKPAGNRMARRAGRTITEVVSDQLRALLVAWCVVDNKGAWVFTKDDVNALMEKSAAALERVVEVAMRLSGMDDDDVESLAEEMIENPFDDSSSP